jgi:hypothetical protein
MRMRMIEELVGVVICCDACVDVRNEMSLIEFSDVEANGILLIFGWIDGRTIWSLGRWVFCEPFFVFL